MRAKLIYNQSLYSSAQGVFEEVKTNLLNSSKHLIIVPERYTLISEKQLLKTLGKNCSLECEVISINRLCNRVFGIGEVLDRQGGIILVQKILTQKQKELQFFKSMSSKLGFALEVYETIMQLKSSGVKPEQVEVQDENKLLTGKMHDIALVYAEYEKYIEQGYTDGTSKMLSLIAEVRTNDFFKSCSVYFAYFEAFTYNDLQFVRELIKNNIPTYIGCRYALASANEHIFTNSIYNQISEIFMEFGLTDVKEYNFVLPGACEHLKSNLFAYNPRRIALKNPHITITSSKNNSLEVASALKRIYYLVAHLGYRYKDINVAVSNLEKYQDLITRELANYDFNYYIDSSISLNNTELGRFVCSLLEAVEYNYMQTDVYALLNNFYFNIPKQEKDFLNAVVTKFKLQGISYLINFNLIQNDKYITNLAKELQIDYKKVLTNFYNKLKAIQEELSAGKNCIDYIASIREILANFNVEESNKALIEQNAKDLSSVKMLEQVLDKLNTLFDQIQSLGFDENYSLINFAKLVNSGLEACKVSLVPLSVDAIYFGDAHASTFEKRKIMFIIGANYNLLPTVNQDVGLVSDREIDYLSSKYLIEPKVSEVNMRSRLKVYELCLIYTQKLFVYYALSTDSGEELHPSLLVTSLQNCIAKFNGEPLKAIDYLDELFALTGGGKEALMLLSGSKKSASNYVLDNLENAKNKNFSSIYTALNNVSDISKLMATTKQSFKKTSIKDLDKYVFKKDGNKTDLSVTELTTYFSCPYYHFAKYGLKLKELLGAELNQIDIGLILHSYAEEFAKELKKNNKPFTIQELSGIKAKVHDLVIKQNENKLNLDVNEIVSKRIIQEGDALMDKLNTNYSQSDFKIDMCEYDFDNYLFYKGKNDYYLKGRIDRIDRYNDNLIMLDYKTGNANFDIKDLYYGKRLQLILYANAVKNILKNVHISGFGYFPIHDKYSKEENADVIDGYFEEYDDIIMHLDTNLKNVEEGDKQVSKMFNFYKQITKKDKKVKYGTKVVEENLFNSLFDYATLVSKQAIKEIEQGYIEAKPLKNGQQCSCDYCPYASICNKELNQIERAEQTYDVQKIKEVVDNNVQTNN